MTTLKRIVALSVLVVALTAARVVQAEETEARVVGVGYKIGNGIGFTGGDLVLRALPHVTADLQANYISDKTTAADGTGIPVTGYGLAPTVQLQLKPVGHTPYIGAGLVYLHLATADATGSAFGLLLNAGYEWRFASHVGVMVGGGIVDLRSIHASSGSSSLDGSGNAVRFNLESGVRYFF
jgi:hypothetical protein